MGSADRDVSRVAIVGAGPSGLFAAQSLVGQSDLPVQVDLIDRLPTPYGLLRYGVAPDPTSIKSVANALAPTLHRRGVPLHRHRAPRRDHHPRPPSPAPPPGAPPFSLPLAPPRGRRGRWWPAPRAAATAATVG